MNHLGVALVFMKNTLVQLIAKWLGKLTKGKNRASVYRCENIHTPQEVMMNWLSLSKHHPSSNNSIAHGILLHHQARDI